MRDIWRWGESTRVGNECLVFVVGYDGESWLWVGGIRDGLFLRWVDLQRRINDGNDYEALSGGPDKVSNDSESIVLDILGDWLGVTLSTLWQQPVPVSYEYHTLRVTYQSNIWTSNDNDILKNRHDAIVCEQEERWDEKGIRGPSWVASLFINNSARMYGHRAYRECRRFSDPI